MSRATNEVNQIEFCLYLGFCGLELISVGLYGIVPYVDIMASVFGDRVDELTN